MAPPPLPGVAAPPVDFERLFEHAPCGYLTTRDNGTVTRVNETFLQWTGRARQDVLGSRLQNMLPVGDQILYSTHCVPQLTIAGTIDEVAIEVLGADGTRHPALLTAIRTPADAGAEASVRVIIFSARERRLYEKELLAARRRAEESEARRAEAEAGLQRLVLQDVLTGLPNRAGLTAGLATALSATRTSEPAFPRLALLFVDLDHFKAVNDSLGHVAGDELLTLMAKRLQSAVRSSGLIARLSGDEFIVVDEVAQPGDAQALAQRLLDVLAVPVVIEGLELFVTASIGVALADPKDTPERLLRHADIAMYRAKAKGRGCWELHDPAASDPATDRLRLLGELRHGIERDELRVHYQPRIDLRTGLLDGVEALVRWQHPTRGLLPPAEFIEAAEDSGLVRDLGAWVLDEAIAQTCAWSASGPLAAVPFTMAINLSVRQLADPGLLDRVRGSLTRNGLPADRLTLEITETALMHDPDTALSTLHSLKALGVGIAVDDFGTGYSSLTYLQRFPVDELKIDRSFTAGVAEHSDDRAIVASCVDLAHAVGMRAVAEGVESAEQGAVLAELGCDLAQGYYYSRPLTSDALVAWQLARTDA